jgi:hypothetical protein
VSIGTLLTGYIYALLAVTVPHDVAEDWAQTSIGTGSLGPIQFPAGAYVAMAILLGIFATAIFLAFVLTEERIAAAMTEALLRDPIDRFVLLAIPFTALTEWAITNQEQLSLLLDTPGSEDTESSGGDSLRV